MSESESRPQPRSGPKRTWLIVAIVIVLLLAVWGVFSRLHSRSGLGKTTAEQSMPTVSVAKVASAPKSEELVLPGNVQAYADAPIYARTSGYLKRWLTDIGTPVKAGQLLAEIDTPEVDQQLSQAQADLQTAEANESLSKSTSDRWQGLLATDSVSKQETDEKSGDLLAKQTQTAAARANLRRLRDTRNFQRVIAPFDGTITARNTDVGQLIGNATGTELFHIASLSRLRVFVQVPQPYAPAAKVGLDAELRFAERAGQAYPAKIVRTAEALDAASRTLLVELQVDNAKGELFPGSYTEVHFKIPAQGDTVRIPANALLFRSQGLQVATLSNDNHVLLKPVTLGRDFGTEVEVTTGLAADESVIVNPPDSLGQGALVRVAAPKSDDKENKGNAQAGDKDSKDQQQAGGQASGDKAASAASNSGTTEADTSGKLGEQSEQDQINANRNAPKDAAQPEQGSGKQP